MRAIHHDGAARTAFTVQAESPEREAQIAALMGAEPVDEHPLQAGDLGHQDHSPLQEELYCAGRWESERSSSEPCPELPLQAA